MEKSINKEKTNEIKEEKKQISDINIFTIGIDILKEIIKFIFYINKNYLNNLRLCCKTFRNFCSPYWKQSVPSLSLDGYLENIIRMGFKIEELNIIENNYLNIIEINYSNIFSKLPQDLIKLTIAKKTKSKDLQYLPANIEYLNLDKMDPSNIYFSDISKNVKFLTLDYKFIGKPHNFDFKIIKDFKNPNIYFQKYIINNSLYKPLLFFPIANNDEQSLLYLLEKGININQKDTHEGKTALIYACEYGHQKIIKLLIDYGSNINEKDKNGENALIIAFKYGYLEIVKLLIQNSTNDNYLKIIDLLIKNNELSRNMNKKDKDGNTPLMLACHNGYLEIVQFLIKNGANVNEKNHIGENALMFASMFGNLKLIMLLFKNNASVEGKGYNGKNVLMFASMCGHLDLMMLLIKYGADINWKDVDGKTALHYAKEYNQIKIIKYLETFI